MCSLTSVVSESSGNGTPHVLRPHSLLGGAAHGARGALREPAADARRVELVPARQGLAARAQRIAADAAVGVQHLVHHGVGRLDGAHGRVLAAEQRLVGELHMLQGIQPNLGLGCSMMHRA